MCCCLVTHSHTLSAPPPHKRPTNTGLVGAVAIYAKGKLDEPGVDREIPLLFNVQNEMQSIYFDVSACERRARGVAGLILGHLLHAQLLRRVLLTNKQHCWLSPPCFAPVPCLTNAAYPSHATTNHHTLTQQDNLALQQNKSKLVIDKTATSFPESNLMHQLNGYIYCNGPTLQLRAGQKVRWLVMGFGSEVDMHSPVFDGQAVRYGGACVE